MLLMETENLDPGLVTAAPVRHPIRPGTDLVKPGVTLEAGMIHSIRRLGVRSVWIHWPGLDFLDEAVSARVENLRQDLFASLKQQFEAMQARSVGVSQYGLYRQMVAELIVELLGQEHHGQGAQVGGLFDHRRDLFSHSANVAYLALTVGLRLETYIARQRASAGATASRDLTNLGIGAMLHDIGKLDSEAPLAEHEPLAEPPSREYQLHVIRGYRMIADRTSATARAIVLHHHQRYDGQGFPDMTSLTRRRRCRPLEGAEIHVFPRVVAVCDAFEHLCHDEQGAPRPVAAALHDLQHEALAGRFDPVVLRGLLQQIPPFPLGSAVRLSDGTDAVVTGLNRLRPCRPTVRPLHVAEESDEAEDIDLARAPELSIVRCLGEDVAACQYAPPADPDARASA